MKWTLVATQQQLESVVPALSAARVLAIDTEFMRRNTFFPQIALLQVSAGENAFLIDPLGIDNTAPIRELFADPRIVKVLHSASEDLEVFDRWLQLSPQPLFDTQRAAGFLDRGFGLGYRAMVEAHCGVQLDKGETRSDWLQRPLTASQCDYAALDVAYLLPVYHEMRAAIEAQGKLEWVFEDGLSATDSAGSASEAYYLRIKSAWKLDSQQLAVLRAVCDWREDQAVLRDKPRSWIISDAACLDIARSRQLTADSLAQIPDLSPGALLRYSDELLACITVAVALPESELPALLPGPLAADERRLLKALKQRGKQIALELGAAPESLLPAKDYETLLRQSMDDTITAPPHWQGWRKPLVIDPLRAFLSARRA